MSNSYIQKITLIASRFIYIKKQRAKTVHFPCIFNNFFPLAFVGTRKGNLDQVWSAILHRLKEVYNTGGLKNRVEM